MIAKRDGDCGKQVDNARAAKRQRSATEANTDAITDAADGTCGDYYDEIIGGNLNGEIRNSWLRCVRSTGSEHNPQPNGSGEDLSSSIQSLTRQLLQAKRRLWPAAERCAQAHDSRPEREFAEARRICNPMEPLGEGNKKGLNQMFMNRAAIKLANIDAILDFALTAVKVENFFFVDLCGAPGGFSEYILKRCQGTRITGSCRGYGMSLVGTNEHGHGTGWNMSRVCHQQGAFQTNYQVSGGADGSGDLYNWANVIALARGIEYDMHFARLRPQKVHLIVADGGFDAQRDSECQEELSQKLVLCEIAAALYLLQEGGTLIIKMFGFQTKTILVAMRDLYDWFDELTVAKPISSRPASAERYVICSGFRGAGEFDGKDWMNSVFLRRESAHDKKRYATLDKKLNEFDRDLLQLNLKACFAILSCLDRKAAAEDSWEMQYEASWDLGLPSLNVEMYRQAWRLT